jgi:hypothetical protein
MSLTGNEYKETVFFKFISLLLRAAKIGITIYLFYQLIMIQTGIFSDGFLFAKAWTLFYIVVAFVTIALGYIETERNPKTYWQEILFKWPLRFFVVGILIFYLFPYAAPLISLKV